LLPPDVRFLGVILSAPKSISTEAPPRPYRELTALSRPPSGNKGDPKERRVGKGRDNKKGKTGEEKGKEGEGYKQGKRRRMEKAGRIFKCSLE